MRVQLYVCTRKGESVPDMVWLLDYFDKSVSFG